MEGLPTPLYLDDLRSIFTTLDYVDNVIMDDRRDELPLLEDAEKLYPAFSHNFDQQNLNYERQNKSQKEKPINFSLEKPLNQRQRKSFGKEKRYFHPHPVIIVSCKDVSMTLIFQRCQNVLTTGVY